MNGLPRLFKSKQALIDFFRGAGVRRGLLDDLADQVRADAAAVRKSHIVRTALTRLNDDGDASLAARREVIKRVVEHEDFTSAWPDDVASAKAFVADARRLVGGKDAVIRVDEARREERRQRMAAKDEAVASQVARRAEYEELRDQLYALFGEQNPWKRGKALERVLNDLCKLHGI